MSHTLIAVTTLAVLSGLLLAAFAPDELAALHAWLARHQTEDAALLARAAAQPTERDPRCPRCRGRHCKPWTDSGADCGAQRHHHHETMWTGGAGLHTPTAVFRRAVTVSWRPPRPAWSTLAERIGALPRVGVLP